ncbi:MAG: sulfatase family protein [Planctomycetota bacterium]|jgi:arylsulfatase A-like enzyme
MKNPNIVFVFGDQWRAQACGYAGNPVVQTPRIDGLAKESIDFHQAVSGCPVCTPYRASLITGQYPLTHGCFVNDVCLSNEATSIAQAFTAEGYDTAYIGKWHIDGHGRSNYIPPERRQGFDYWKVLECTHDYNESYYYANDSEEKLTWEGYDAVAQTEDAIQYMEKHDGRKPFLLMLSWGGPHAPYLTAPDEYRERYRREDIVLRDNVPPEKEEQARKELAGYYAHCTVLDDCMGRLLDSLEAQGKTEDTIFVFTSDHGDMIGSQGRHKKQQPWEESIRVPFLLRWPKRFGNDGRKVKAMIDAPDVLPTLLGLIGATPPASAEGANYAPYLEGDRDPKDGLALLQCPHPFGQFSKRDHGGREYRGIRTDRYTYTRDLEGPWLLYDNREDPYQLRNLVEDPGAASLIEEMDRRLSALLETRGDAFLPGLDYVNQWLYTVDKETLTVPYTN